MESRTLKVGVIGAGIGRLHIDGYAQVPGVEILALAGQDDDRVKQLAAEYHIRDTVREYQDLIANPEVEAVSVCVPNLLHAPVAIAALQAGKHVLVEKPIARNAVEGRAIVDAARAAGKVLMVSF